MCPRTAPVARLGPYASDLQLFCPSLSLPSVLFDASTAIFASLSTIRRNCAALGPVDARKSRSDPRAPQRIEDCAGEGAPQPKSE